MIVYLDTSVVLRILFNQPAPLRQWGTWESGYSSELLEIESRRAIDRLRLEGDLDDEGVAKAHEELAKIESAMGRVRLSPTILRRATLPMPTAVKTLDAIHLTSALALRERRDPGIFFATHDGQQRIAARALGFVCLG